MIRFDERVLPNAKDIFGTMMAYIICDCKFNPSHFMNHFVKSKYARDFTIGNESVLQYTGVEIAQDILLPIKPDIIKIPYGDHKDSEEYKVGELVCEYQWESGYRFSDIMERIGIHGFQNLKLNNNYFDRGTIMHILNDAMLQPRFEQTKLEKLRKAKNLTVLELSKQADLCPSSIGNIENHRATIDRMRVGSVYRMSLILECDIEDLLEDPMHIN